jgi:hypothetical protein
MKDWAKAKQAAGEVLALDPDNLKAMFRWVQAGGGVVGAGGGWGGCRWGGGRVQAGWVQAGCWFRQSVDEGGRVQLRVYRPHGHSTAASTSSWGGQHCRAAHPAAALRRCLPGTCSRALC